MNIFRAGELCKGCDCIDCYNDGKHEEVLKLFLSLATNVNMKNIDSIHQEMM